MDIEKLKYEAQNKALHIADVSSRLISEYANLFSNRRIAKTH